MAKRGYTVLLIGQPRVGKTTLFHRITSRSAPAKYESTQGFSDLIPSSIDTSTTFYFMDTDGTRPSNDYPQDFFNPFSKGTFFLMYDTTNQKSFDCLPEWIEGIKSKIRNPNITIIANKKDLQDERQVETQTGQQFAISHQCAFFEISARDDLNFDPLLHSITERHTEKQSKIATLSQEVEALEADYKKCVKKRFRSIFTCGYLGADEKRFTLLAWLKKSASEIENDTHCLDKHSAFIRLLEGARAQVKKQHQGSKIPCLATQSDLVRCINQLVEKLDKQLPSQRSPHL